jgi:GTP-binding protein LepA
MEIVQERLEREYDLDLITTAPTVVYEILDTKGNIVSPTGAPSMFLILAIKKPTSPAFKLAVLTRLGVNTPTT